MALVFNGTTRQIEVTDSSIFTLDVGRDIYSEWKRWQQQDTANAGYAPAFRTFGGDATALGQFAPKYYFLINYWTVLINNGNVVSIALNLYSDDFASPYVVLSGGVSDRNSDAVNVNEEDIKSQSFLNAEVTLDTGDGVAGVVYPIGTPPRPSSNLPDALTIMNNQGLHRIGMKGFVTATATELLDQVKIIGTSGSGNVLVLAGTTTDQSDFENIIVAGTFDGLSRVRECVLGTTGLGGVVGVEGRITESIINHVDGIVQKAGGAGTFLDNCNFTAPNNQQVTFDANGEGFTFRNCNGNILIKNMTKAEALQINIDGAIVELDSTCTSGTLVFSGYGKIIDNSGVGCTVLDDALVQNLVWGADVSQSVDPDSAGYKLEKAKGWAEIAALNP
jgi:hypothetical protein